MKITTEDHDQVSVVTLRGELASEAVESLRRTAQERLDNKVRDIVLDCSALESVDSRGLEALLWLQEQCGERLGQIRLAGASETFEKILEMTRLASRLDRHPDVDTALRSLR
jgi:anti-sigma B factor antagonist